MHVWQKTDPGAWFLISSQLLAAIPMGPAGAHLYTAPFLLGAVCYALAIGIFYWFFHAVRPLPEEREVTAHGPAAAAD